MASQLLRRSILTSAMRQRRPTQLAQLPCEQLETRVTPALFNAQTALTFTGLNNNRSVAVADFNKDGFADAVLPNGGTDFSTGAGSTITILSGKSGGGFTETSINSGGSNIAFACVADINGDGWQDVVALNANQQETGSVSVFRNNNGTLSLVGTPFAAAGRNSFWVGLADVTGDNVLDVVTAHLGKAFGKPNVEGNTIAIFQGYADTSGKGDFTYSATPITTISPSLQFSPSSLTIADFDADGKQDIAAAVLGLPPDFNQAYPNGSVYLFKGTGGGAFAAPTIVDSGGVLPLNIQAVDVNGDTKKDLIIANAGDPGATGDLGTVFTKSSVAVMLNTSSIGNMSFSAANAVTTNCQGTAAVAVADFNLDTKVDIAAINAGNYGTPGVNSYVAIYLGNGSGTFTPDSPSTYDTLANAATADYLVVGDFDNNTTPDLIVANLSSSVGLLLNTSTPASVTPTVTGVTTNNLAVQRSRVSTLAVTFNSPVTLLSGAFTLTRKGLPNGGAGDNALVGSIGVSTQLVSGATVATLTFSGSNTTAGSLDDGNWTLTVDHTKVQATTGGTPMAADFTQANIKRLFGDANGDNHVDNADFFAFRGSFLQTSGQTGYFAYFDFNNDGAVDNADFFAFRSRFLTSI